MPFPPTPSWKSSFKPSRAIEMPGSPYLDEPPKGLLTWPKLLERSACPVRSSLLPVRYHGVLLEALVVITVSMLVVNWMAR